MVAFVFELITLVCKTQSIFDDLCNPPNVKWEV